MKSLWYSKECDPSYYVTKFVLDWVIFSKYKTIRIVTNHEEKGYKKAQVQNRTYKS